MIIRGTPKALNQPFWGFPMVFLWNFPMVWGTPFKRLKGTIYDFGNTFRAPESRPQSWQSLVAMLDMTSKTRTYSNYQ